MRQKTVLVVIDGLGLRKENEGNAFKQADTPNLGRLMSKHGFQKLEASGPAVGLPEGYAGNSEVGHLHLGSGRTIPQRLTRINQAIKEDKLREKEALKKSLKTAEQQNQTVHLAGIISDGGIHGHIKHLKALMKISSEYNAEVKIHCFTDGRDVKPKSAQKYIETIQQWCNQYGGEIATITGRYYSMDRDNNWERTQKAYQTMTQAKGFKFSNPKEALQKTYEEGDYDYFTQPSASKNYEGMQSNDLLIFYNFRADRERQIAEAFLKKDFQKFQNQVKPNFISMLPYRKDFQNPVLFQKQIVENTLGEKLEEAGLSQLRVAESQKKPHVTYFFNGQREKQFEHEERKFVESDKIKSYDKKPEMHADQLTKIVKKAIQKGEKDFILLNYANCDLVGHTGNLKATKKAVETVDKNIGKLQKTIKNSDYSMIITADHGNCENMGSKESRDTSHTKNKVPLIVTKTKCGGGEKITFISELVENKLNISEI